MNFDFFFLDDNQRLNNVVGNGGADIPSIYNVSAPKNGAPNQFSWN